MPLPGTPARKLDLPSLDPSLGASPEPATNDRAEKTEPEEADDQPTRSIPRIESAIPSEDELRSDATHHDHLPRMKVVLTAAIASVVVVGGTVLAITHPWNPQLTSQRATTAADTSSAGFPGTIEKLVGQDSSATTEAATTEASTEQTPQTSSTYSSLAQYYTRLGEIDEAVTTYLTNFEATVTSDDATAKSTAKKGATALSVEVSNMISGLGQLDTSASSSYATDVTQLTKLANWQRNRLDALTSAWTLAGKSSSVSANITSIMQPISSQIDSTSGKNAYEELFQQYYSSWDPAALEAATTS